MNIFKLGFLVLGNWGPSISEAVRNYILEYGEGTPSEIAEDLKERLKGEGYLALPDRGAVNKILNCAHQLDLVRVIRTGRGEDRTGRVFRVSDPKHRAWRNPCLFLQDREKFERESELISKIKVK